MGRVAFSGISGGKRMITKICSAIRCFFSDLLFEKIFGWRNVDDVAFEIQASVTRNNYDSRTHCYACDGDDLIHDISGSVGLFTSTHQFYRCRKCGNAQDTNGDTYQYNFEALEEVRIIRDGERYRYIFLRFDWWNLISCIAVAWAMLYPLLFVSFQLFDGGFPSLQSMIIGFAPLALLVLCWIGGSFFTRSS